MLLVQECSKFFETYECVLEAINTTRIFSVLSDLHVCQNEYNKNSNNWKPKRPKAQASLFHITVCVYMYVYVSQ